MFLKIRIEQDKYDQFQSKCEQKDKTMSEVLRNFMKLYNDNDNTIIFNLDDNMLNEVAIFCKDKKIKFNDLIKLLIERTINNKDNFNA